MIRPQLVRSFTSAALSPDPDLAVAALMIARIEYPALDASPYLAQLDAIGEEARRRVNQAPATAAEAPPQVDPDRYAKVMALNGYLFGEMRFVGNEVHYEDPRNSFLNEVLDRRIGIPISLAVVYLEVARRAGLHVDGVNFPGHFLLRARDAVTTDAHSEVVIIDPFHGGARLSEYDCRQLLRQHVGDEAAFDSALLVPATRHEIVVRILVNLKRLYVRMRSFPQARAISSLLLGIDPAAVSELRDRGLLAYHLEDFPAALRDLEEYLRLSPKSSDWAEHDLVAGQDGDGAEDGEPEQLDDASQIWEHVKTLRKRVAGFN